MQFIKDVIKTLIPFYRKYEGLRSTKMEISYVNYINYLLFGNKTYWKIDKSCYVSIPERVFVGYNSNIGRANNFIQSIGGVFIGNYVQFATRVSLLSNNHDLYDHDKYHTAPIVIGDYCWLGMNTTILAGVVLGERTIVAAGAVVNKSFQEGYCVVAGVPAKIVKHLDKDLFRRPKYQEEWYGFIPKEKFEKNINYYFEKYLDVNILKEKCIYPLLSPLIEDVKS